MHDQDELTLEQFDIVAGGFGSSEHSIPTAPSTVLNNKAISLVKPAYPASA
jgi:hypothetical protein